MVTQSGDDKEEKRRHEKVCEVFKTGVYWNWDQTSHNKNTGGEEHAVGVRGYEVKVVCGEKDSTASKKAASTQQAPLFSSISSPALLKSITSDNKTEEVCRILEIRPGDSKFWWRRVWEVKEVVDVEMGFVDDTDEKGKEGKTAFLFVNSSYRIIGMLICEGIKEGYKIDLEETTKSSDNNEPFLFARHTTPIPAKLGVYQIWTHKSHRSRKIAKSLLDIARNHFIFGLVVKKGEIGFSSPTEDGVRLGRGYCGAKGF